MRVVIESEIYRIENAPSFVTIITDHIIEPGLIAPVPFPVIYISRKVRKGLPEDGKQ
jgi:hypothetical protein